MDEVSPFPEFSIAALRAELGWTLERMAEAVGIASKGRMSQIERGIERPPLKVALEIEKLSAGRIDAAALNPDVAAARKATRPIAMCGEGFAG